VYLAVQCCEHLNRALVVERPAAERYGFEEVSVCRCPTRAGGRLPRRCADSPLRWCGNDEAPAGIDIGATLLGMHIQKVAVPVRLEQKYIGKAAVTAARHRPKLIGGARAVYELPPCY
jgi:uncharacterized protein (TIGR01440 family)